MNNSVTRGTENGTNIPTPQVLWKILWTPAMQALISLSRLQDVSPSYYGQNVELKLLHARFKPEDFNALTWRLLPECTPNTLRSTYWKFSSNRDDDINILSWELNNWDEVRELCNAWFLITDSVIELYTKLSQLGKVNFKELKIGDASMFWYEEFEMRQMIAVWEFFSAPIWPMRDRIIEALKQQEAA